MNSNYINYHEEALQKQTQMRENNFQKIKESLCLTKKQKSMNYNYWSLEEQTIYLGFLVENSAELSGNGSRRKLRMFKKISTLLGTRTPKQVKSHHQKLEEKFKSIQKIIIRLSKSIKLKKNDYMTTIEVLNTPSSLNQNQNTFPIQFSLVTDVPFFGENYLESFLKFTYQDSQYSPCFN